MPFLYFSTVLSSNSLIADMNYLAHACLSFGHPEILVGNMISDFVKGKSKFSFSSGIQQGISLHRDIDAFTDQHAVTREAKKIFQPAYRLYSSAFIDVVYDHFLATDDTRFSDQGLKQFSIQTYAELQNFESVFPLPFGTMFPHMKKHNWLYNYRLESGIQRSFDGLVYRASFMHESDTAFRLFIENYSDLKIFYQQFYPDLESFARNKLNSLLTL